MNEKINMINKERSQYVKTEIIDGVKVCYTGRKYRLENSIISDVDMFDSNGNRFYSNYSSLAEAQKAIIELAAEGINAVVGPKAPWNGSEGKMIPNQCENDVALYIVEEKEKTEGAPTHGLR